MADERRMQLAEHFESLEVQSHSARLGMWIFLGSETLLFGALFGLYLAYRVLYTDGFVEALHHNDQLLGTLNTAVLLTSSLTVALAVDAVRRNLRRRGLWLLGATLVLGVAFLGIKFHEYSVHFQHGIYPGSYYDNPELSSHGAVLFFTLYFFMTGLHALHVIGGLCAMVVLAVLHWRRSFSSRDHLPVELAGLYWHLVDVVWIFLWPLFYLLK